MIYSASKIIKMHLDYLKVSSTEQMIAFTAVGLLIISIALSAFLNTHFSNDKSKKSLLRKLHLIFATLDTLFTIVLILGAFGVMAVHSENLSSHAQHDYRVVYARMYYRSDRNIEANKIHSNKKLQRQFKEYKYKHHDHIKPDVDKHYHELSSHYAHQIVVYGHRTIDANAIRRDAIIGVKPTRGMRAIKNTAQHPWNFINPTFSVFCEGIKNFLK